MAAGGGASSAARSSASTAAEGDVLGDAGQSLAPGRGGADEAVEEQEQAVAFEVLDALAAHQHQVERAGDQAEREAAGLGPEVVGLEQRPAGGTGVPGLDGAEPGEEHDAGTRGELHEDRQAAVDEEAVEPGLVGLQAG